MQCHFCHYDCELIETCENKHMLCNICELYNREYCGICNDWMIPLRDKSYRPNFNKLSLTMGYDDLPIPEIQSCGRGGSDVTYNSPYINPYRSFKYCIEIVISKQRIANIFKMVSRGYNLFQPTPTMLKEIHKLSEYVKTIKWNLGRLYAEYSTLLMGFNHDPKIVDVFDCLLSWYPLQKYYFHPKTIYGKTQLDLLQILTGIPDKKIVVGITNLIDISINSINEELYDHENKTWNWNVINRLNIPIDIKARILQSKICFLCKRLFNSHYIIEIRNTHRGRRKIKKCAYC